MRLETKDYKQFTIDNISFDDYHQANRCLPGDTVEWDGEKCILQKRGDHRFLVGVLELNSKYIYGHTSRGVKIYLFHPFDTSYPPMRVGCSERDTSKNQLALVKFDSWTEKIPRGNLIRLLGPVGDVEAEKEALLWLYGKPELKKMTFDIESPKKERRVIQEANGKTINIDPEGCKDIDDILTLIPREDAWELIITIADVAEAISEGSPGDLLAAEKGQTLYQEGKAVLPMLPSSLSEDQLSLLPGKTRQGLSLFCSWKNNTLTVNGFEEVTITNRASYTYESIYKAEADFPIIVLQEIASHLKGEVTTDSHEWIEQLMLLYNLEGAKVLLQANAGLLRTHKAADQQKLEAFESIHPDLRIFAFESASYELTGEGKIHATLGNKPYTHLTSPLRRYADLVNQRVLKAFLHSSSSLPCSPSLPSNLNQIQKKQKKHDRDLFFLQQILKQTTGSIDGIVVESTEAKTKVYIPVWKRVIKVKNTELISPSSQVTVEYYADLRKISWRDRIVFRMKN